VELDATTFVLEIINFGILLWILWRFLYAPVRTVIAQRRAAIEKSLAEARETHAAAETMQAEYENRLTDWEGERERRRATLQEEMSAERVRRLQALQAELAGERERAHVLEARRTEAVARRSAEEAVTQAARFAARLLSRLSGPELEARILTLFIEDVRQLPEDQCKALRAACEEQAGRITVVSAHPLSPSQRDALRAGLHEITGGDRGAWEFVCDAALIAGVRVGVGPWLLRATVRDELEFFTEAGRGTRIN